MKKIAIFQTDLNVGGIQKSLVNLINNIDLDSYKIDLYLTKNDDYFYKNFLPKEVNIMELKRKNKFLELLPFELFKKMYEKEYKKFYSNKHYDASFDFNSYNHSCALSAITVNSDKKFIWAHNDISKKRKEEVKYDILWKLMKSKYKYFDEYFVVSKGIKEAFINEASIEDIDSVKVLPNIVNIEEIKRLKDEKIEIEINNNEYNLVFVGRLCHQKGVDILINLFNEVLNYRQDIHLYIIGDGPDKEKIINKIKEFNIKDKITLLGNKKNPYKYMEKMDGFILTSRYEGQGIVVREAQVIGLDLFISDNLKDYNEGVETNKNLLEDLINAEKSENNPVDLSDYKKNIIRTLKESI